MPNVHSLLQGLLVRTRFWDSLVGRVTASLLVSAVINVALKNAEPMMVRVVDATVQASLFNRLSDTRITDLGCEESEPCLRVIGIDDEDFRIGFRQRSPLDPEPIQALLLKLRDSPPRLLAIDLDLSPADADDRKKREGLLKSLADLSRTTQILMVCPKGFDSGNPSPFDLEWVVQAGAHVEFVSAALSQDGLYYPSDGALKTLGLATARAASRSRDHAATAVGSGRSEQSSGSLRAGASQRPASVEDCAEASSPERSTADLKMIRPHRTLTTSFRDALDSPGDFRGNWVFLGGRWSGTDQFWLRGVDVPIHGVDLHAWVAKTELKPPINPSPVQAKLLEVVVGVLSGLLLSRIWQLILRNRDSFAARSFWYACFLALSIGLPVGMVWAAVMMADFNVAFSAAGMVAAAAVDVFLSSHKPALRSREGRSAWSYLKDQHFRSQLAKLGRAHFLTVSALTAVATLMTFDHTVEAYAMGGFIAGLLLAWADLVTPREELNVEAEGTLDLFGRFVWLVICVLIFVYTAHQTYDLATWGLVASFALGALAVKAVDHFVGSPHR